MNRYLSEFIRKDLAKKAVLLCGPRQVGKTTLAKSLNNNLTYLNYDIVNDRKIIMQKSWDQSSDILVLDELHKLKKWKTYLKGIIDEFENSQKLLVTGSAKLDVFRKAGDALTGRTFLYHLHPIDIAEALSFDEKNNPEIILEKLIITGGFPESYFNPQDSKRFLLDRLATVLREDLQDLSKITQIKTLELLIELLRERVGGQLNYANLASDLSISPPTAKKWIELLEKLYLIFLVRPFATKSNKSIKKDHKFYFFDSSAVLGDEGAVLENIVALSLLKWCDFKRDVEGRNLHLRYYRDSNKREVDFVILENKKALACIEVKTSDDAPSSSLLYLTKTVEPKHAFQIVKNLDRPKDISQVKIRKLAPWLANIDKELI